MVMSDFSQLRIPDTTDLTELGQVTFPVAGGDSVVREIVLAGSGVGMMFADSRLKTNALTWVGALLIGASIVSLTARI